MTDFDAATAWNRVKAASAVLCVVIAGLGLGGCETAGTILGGDQVATQTVAPSPVTPAAPQMLASIALAPLIGAPDPIAAQLRDQVVKASEKSRIAIVADRDPKADFGMRGYIVAARDKGAIKVSYIWDITDPSGKRVNRITGEEVAPQATGGKDPWAAVTPAVTQAVADKIASSLGAWVPSQPKATPVAAVSGRAAGAGAGTLAPGNQASPGATAPAAAASLPASTTTASLPPSGELAAVVPAVVGAPGDGNTALADALQRELSRGGVKLSDQAGAYRVEGKVAMGAVKDGKQTIQIDWRVKDSKGTAVGTVTQKNSVPPGSLDGSWGKTADAAAAAAAQGIIKLLPQSGRATN
ncbi:MAG: hypothetical protein SFW09_22590 [Hyphomicrobiaceae bacterium]|nr:hypothetical protein [Hyphomicrobiaceae bacterium]